MIAFLKSSIGRKLIMAVTGLMLVGFVVAHLMGNLLVFAGPDALNAYAKKLRDLGGLLWVARGGLIAAVAVHILTAISLVRDNRAARPVPYARYSPAESTMAGRTMALSGVLVLAYIIYHLLHFTFRVTHPEISHFTDSLGRHDVYSMVVYSFQNGVVSAVYVAALLVLCLHLTHGIGSLVQTLGVNNDKTLKWVRCASGGLAGLLFLGYASIPIAVLIGLIHPAGGLH